MKYNKNISIIVLAVSNLYVNTLYGLLYKKYNVNSINISSISLKKLLYILGKKPIIHIHWIEHKYTLGKIYNIGQYSKYIILLTSVMYIYFISFIKFVLNFHIVTTLHNVIPHHILIKPLEYSIFKITLNLSDKIFVHSQYVKQITNKYYDIKIEKIVKIPHGNWIKLNKSNINKIRARKILKIESNAFVMCYIGRLSSDKGIHILLNTINNLNVNRPSYLIIAGSPTTIEYYNLLNKKINNINTSIKILFYPKWISEYELKVFIKASNCGILPYIKTTTPSTVLLFMTFGKPVIVPDLTEIKEYIGINYPLIYDGSEKGLKKMIIKCIFEMDLIDLGKKTKARSLTFDWNNTALITYNTYKELVHYK